MSVVPEKKKSILYSLQVLKESLDNLVQQTKSLMRNSDSNCLSTLHPHNQRVLKQQLQMVEVAFSELQVTRFILCRFFFPPSERGLKGILNKHKIFVTSIAVIGQTLWGLAKD